MAILNLKHLLNRSTSHSPNLPGKPKYTIEDLPTEIVVLVFEELDVIDACCLSLCSPRLYTIHASTHATPPPLTTPCPLFPARLALLGPAALGDAISKYRTAIVRSRPFAGPPPLCPHSCSSSCQLHHHIRDWMPQDTIFCSACERFSNWCQTDGFRCPCREAKARRAKGVGRGWKRWRRRSGVAGREGGADAEGTGAGARASWGSGGSGGTARADEAGEHGAQDGQGVGGHGGPEAIVPAAHQIALQA